MPFLSKINATKGLEYDPIIRHEVSYQGPDSIAGVFSTFTHSWLAYGAKIFVINHSDGSIQSSWTFGEKPSDLVEITCAIELQFEGCCIPLLIVGVCSENTNKICVYNPNTRKLIRTIECNFPIRVLCIIEDGLNDVNPLNDALTHTQGLLAVGCADGSLYVVDLCRNLLLKALNGDFRYISDEQNPVEVNVIDVTSVTSSGIQEKLKECYSNQSSLAVKLSDDCDDGVTALCYSFESAILYVGTSAGSFILWNMTNLSCLFHSPNTSKAVTSLSLLEPCDDPMHNLFLWVCYENHSHAVMYSISFSTKFFVPGYGVYYQGFESAGLVYKLVLGRNENVIVQRAINSLAIAKSIPKNLAKTFKISDSECTQLRLFVTALEVISDGVQESRVVVFDLNQWYKEQLPNEGLSSCVEVVELGSGGLWHLALDPSSLSHYQWVRPLEQHFHPSALDFRLWCIEDEGIRCLEKLGLQSQWLRNMTLVGPSALLSPQQIFHGAISAGLLPTFIDPPDLEYTTIEEERKYILTVCLENRATSVIEHCAQEWSTGSHPVAGCTLGFLIDWLWELHGNYKSQGNKMCIPLFDQSGLVFDISERKALQHCKSLLNTVQTLYTNIIRKYSNFVLIDGLEQKLAAMSLVKFYFDCCLKLISVNLLPEPSEAGRPADSIAYKYHEINNFVCMKRKEGPFLGDSLTGRTGGEKEWEEEGGTGRYPPPSIQAVLRYCLHPAPTTWNKLSLMLYLYTDIINSHTPLRDQGNIEKVKNFQYLLRIPDVQYKIVIAFWYLDHNLFYEGTSLLFDPRILPIDVSDDQHRSILRLLALQGQEKLGLQYLRLKASDLHQLDDFRLELDLLLSNRLINEAFMFQRKHPEYREELLIQFFQGCIEKRLLGQVFGLHLDPKEESVLFKFLKLSDLKNKNDLQVLLLLSRAKYTEAVSLNDRINSTINGPKARLETDTRDMIVRGVTGGLNAISKDIAQEMRHYRPPPPGTCPKPLSALIKVRSEPDGPLLQTDSRVLLSAAAKSTRHLLDYVNSDERASRKRGFDEHENMDIDFDDQPRKKPALWNGIIRGVVAPSTPLKSSNNQEREVMELVGTPLVKKRGKRISPHSKPSSILKAKTPQRGQTHDDQSDTPSRKTLRFALPENEKQLINGRSLFGSDIIAESTEPSGTKEKEVLFSERVSGRKSLRSVSVADEAEKEINDTSTLMESIRDRLRSSKNKLLGDGAVDWKNVAETSQPKVLFTPGSNKNPIKSTLKRLTQPLVQTPPHSAKDPTLDITITSSERKYLDSPSREMEDSPLTESIFTTTLMKKLPSVEDDDDEEESNDTNQESSLEKYKRLRSQNMFSFKKSQVNENEDATCSKNDLTVTEKYNDLSKTKRDEDEKLSSELSIPHKEDLNDKKVCQEDYKSYQEDTKSIIQSEDIRNDQEDIKSDNDEVISNEDEDEINQDDAQTGQEETNSEDFTNHEDSILHITKVISGAADMFPLDFEMVSESQSQPKGDSSDEASQGESENQQKALSIKEPEEQVICLSSDEENEEDKSVNGNSNDSSPSYSSQEYDEDPQNELLIEINSESESEEYSLNESEDEHVDDSQSGNDGDDIDENIISGIDDGNGEENVARSVRADDSDSDDGSEDRLPSIIPTDYYSPHELNEDEGGIVIMDADSEDERPYHVADLLARHNMDPDPFLSDIVPIKVASKYEIKCEKSSQPKKEYKPDSSEIAEQSKYEIISTEEYESAQKLNKPEFSADHCKTEVISATEENDSKILNKPGTSGKNRPDVTPPIHEIRPQGLIHGLEDPAGQNKPEVTPSTDESNTTKLKKLEVPGGQNQSEIIPSIEESSPKKLNKLEISAVHNKPKLIVPSEESKPEIIPSAEESISKKCDKPEAYTSQNKPDIIALIEENSSKKLNKQDIPASQNKSEIIPSIEVSSPEKLNKPETSASESKSEVIHYAEESIPKKLNKPEVPADQNISKYTCTLSTEGSSPRKFNKQESSPIHSLPEVILLTGENERHNKLNRAIELSKPDASSGGDESESVIQPSLKSATFLKDAATESADTNEGCPEDYTKEAKDAHKKNIMIGKIEYKTSKGDSETCQTSRNLESSALLQSQSFDSPLKRENDKEELGELSKVVIHKEIEYSKISSSSSESNLKHSDNKSNVPEEIHSPSEVYVKNVISNKSPSLQMEDISSTSENNIGLFNQESKVIQSDTIQDLNTSVPKHSEEPQLKGSIVSGGVTVSQGNVNKEASPKKELSYCIETAESQVVFQNQSLVDNRKLTDTVCNASTSEGKEILEPGSLINEFEPKSCANDKLKSQNTQDVIDLKKITNDDASCILETNLDTNNSVSSSGELKVDLQNVVLKTANENISLSVDCADVSLKSETKEDLISSTSKNQPNEAENTSKTKANITPEKVKKDTPSKKQIRGSSVSTESSICSDVAADKQVQIKSFFFGRDEKNETYLRTTERVTFQVGSRASIPSEDEPVDPLETAMIEEVEEDAPSEENYVHADESEETDPRNTCMLDVDLSLHLSEDELIVKPGMVDKGVVTSNSYFAQKNRRSIKHKDTKVSEDIENPEVMKSERKKLPGLLPIVTEKVHDDKEKDQNKLEKQSFGTQTSDTFFSNKDDLKKSSDSKTNTISGKKKSSAGLQANSEIVNISEIPSKLDSNSNDKRERRSRRSSITSQVTSNNKEGELKGILKKSNKVPQANFEKEEDNEEAGTERDAKSETSKGGKSEGSKASKETRGRRSRRSSVSSQSSEMAHDFKNMLEEFSEENKVPRPLSEPEPRGILKKEHSLNQINDGEKALKRQNNFSDDELVSKEKNSRKSCGRYISDNNADKLNTLERKRSARHSSEPELRGILKNRTEVKCRGSCTSESAADLLKRLEEDFPEVRKRSRRYSEEPELPGILKNTEEHYSGARKKLSSNKLSVESKTQFKGELDDLKKFHNKLNTDQKNKAGSSHMPDFLDQDLDKERDKQRSRRLSEEPQIQGILKNKADTRHISGTETVSDFTNRLSDDLPENQRRRRHSFDSESLAIKTTMERRTRRRSQVADDVGDDYDGTRRRLRSYSEEPEVRGILKNCEKRKSSSYSSETSRDFKLRLNEDFTEEKKTRRRRYSVDSDLGAKDIEKTEKKSRRYSCTSEFSNDDSVADKHREKLSTELGTQPEHDSSKEKKFRNLDDDRYLTTGIHVPVDIVSSVEKKGKLRRKSISEEPIEVRRSSRQTTPDNKYKSPNRESKRKLTSQKDSLFSKRLDFSEEDSPPKPKKSKSLQDFPIRRSTRLHPILEKIQEEEEETPVKKKRKSMDDLDAHKIKVGAKSTKKKEAKKFPSLVIVNSDDDEDDANEKDNWTENYAKERRLTRTQKKVLMRNTTLIEGLSPHPVTPSTPESSTPKKSRRRPSISESSPKTPTRTSLRLQKKPPSESD